MNNDLTQALDAFMVDPDTTYHLSRMNLGDYGLDRTPVVQPLEVNKEQSTSQLNLNFGCDKLGRRFPNNLLEGLSIRA